MTETKTPAVPSGGEIMSYDRAALVGSVINVFDAPEPERSGLLAYIRVRAADLDIDKQVEKLINAYERQAGDAEYSDRRDAARKRNDIDLQLDYKGSVACTIGNFYAIMTHDSRYAGVKFNMVSNRPEVHAPDGSVSLWTDTDDALSRAYIEGGWHIHSKEKHRDAFLMLLRDREYNPVRDMIDALVWDGTPRIGQFLHVWGKADDTPYTREVSRLIFAGGVNRAYDPGCKFDDVPVLVGAQGAGKSTLVRWLAMNESFYADLSEFEGKEAIEQLDGVWIGEIGELLAMTRLKDQEAAKDYITRQKDRIRRPWGERIEELPRKSVFIGTTNNAQFLRDMTGGRRYYPVTLHMNGYELHRGEAECRRYIAQCWAEAKALYDRQALPPYADEKLVADIAARQNDAMEDDWRIGAIGAYLETRQPGEAVCARELMHMALSPDPDRPQDPTKRDALEIGQIMTRDFPAWERVGIVRTSRYGAQRCWRKKTEEVEFL